MQMERLTTPPKFGYSEKAVLNHIASLGKLNFKETDQADNALDLYIFTPSKRGNYTRFSMVGCSRAVFLRGCFFFLSSFSNLLHSTARSLERLSGSFQKFKKRTIPMIFQFFTGKKPLINIYAQTKAEALSRVKWSSRPLCVAILPDDYFTRKAEHMAQISANFTACNHKNGGIYA